jgi:hypothetical protein
MSEGLGGTICSSNAYGAASAKRLRFNFKQVRSKKVGVTFAQSNGRSCQLGRGAVGDLGDCDHVVKVVFAAGEQGRPRRGVQRRLVGQ